MSKSDSGAPSALFYDPTQTDIESGLTDEKVPMITMQQAPPAQQVTYLYPVQ